MCSVSPIMCNRCGMCILAGLSMLCYVNSATVLGMLLCTPCIQVGRCAAIVLSYSIVHPVSYMYWTLCLCVVYFHNLRAICYNLTSKHPC